MTRLSGGAVPALLSLLALASCAGGPSPAGPNPPGPGPTKVRVHFAVTVPTSTPADAALYLASNAGDWNPGDPRWRLARNPDGSYGATFDLAPGFALEYKITRGDWDRVEKGPGGTERPNRNLLVVAPASGPLEVTVEVGSWRDQSGDGARSSTVTGRLEIVKDFPMPGLGRTRTLRIWLPPDYANSGVAYPVLYMADGQNLFDAATSFAGEWRIDEAMTAFAARKDGPGAAIVVGVDNGEGERLNEYSPFADPNARAHKGDLYIDFLVANLKPWIDAHYRTLPDRGHTALGGSSMGGLISLYGALTRPGTFGKALCMSSAFWFGDGALLRLVKSKGAAVDLKVYLDVGGRELGLPSKNEAMVNDTRDMYAALRAAGIPESNLKLVIDAEAGHNEAAWARRFPAAWEWLAE